MSGLLNEVERLEKRLFEQIWFLLLIQTPEYEIVRTLRDSRRYWYNSPAYSACFELGYVPLRYYNPYSSQARNFATMNKERRRDYDTTPTTYEITSTPRRRVNQLWTMIDMRLEYLCQFQSTYLSKLLPRDSPIWQRIRYSRNLSKAHRLISTSIIIRSSPKHSSNRSITLSATSTFAPSNSA